MTRLPRLNGREVIKVLNGGFRADPCQGQSSFCCAMLTDVLTTVPVHGGEIIGPGPTQQDIARLRFDTRRIQHAHQGLISGASTTGRAEPAGRPGAGLCGLDFAVAGRGVGDEGGEQLVRRMGHLVHRPVEGELVRLGGWAKPLSLRTNWSADARISSSVAGGSKLCRVLMLRHMGAPRRRGRGNSCPGLRRCQPLQLVVSAW